MKATTTSTTPPTGTKTIQSKRNCQWGQWSDWSICSKTCGCGMRTRTSYPTESRKAGIQCQQKPKRQSEQCNSKTCESITSIQDVNNVENVENDCKTTSYNDDGSPASGRGQ